MIYDIRPMTPQDAPPLAALLNHTIALGGSTAYETPFDPQGFQAEFLTGAAVQSSRVAWRRGIMAGFQTLFFLEDTPEALAIATFADQRTRRPGVGRAMMATTRSAARAQGARYIRAVIRADNASGLRYYRGQGFQDHEVRRAVPLTDGTPVDRIETRLML